MNGTQVPVCSSGCMTAPPTGMMRLPAAAETERGPAWAGPRKKLLAICQIMQYNKDKANKGRDVESWNLPTPLCRRWEPPTQQNFCATPIIPGIFPFYKGEIRVGLCAISGCAGIIAPAQPFYSPRLKRPREAVNAPLPAGCRLGRGGDGGRKQGGVLLRGRPGLQAGNTQNGPPDP